MSTVETLNISLTPEQAAALRAAVERGEYASTSEAVRDAIQGWLEIRAFGEEDVERLRHLWDEGAASGPAFPVDMDALRREARARLDDAQKA